MNGDTITRPASDAQPAPQPPKSEPANPGGPLSVGQRLAAGRVAARAARKVAKTQCNPPQDATSGLHPSAIAVLADCPSRSQKRYLLALSGRGGLKNAVKVMCLHCCGWQLLESAKCTAAGCPLTAFNPYKAKAERRLSGRALGESGGHGV